MDALPPPHNPWRCKHIGRFRRIEGGKAGDGRDWFAASREAGTEFLATLTPGDLAKCRWHRADWKGVADASVAILAALGRRDPAEYVAEAERAPLGLTDRRWLISLFADPIYVAGDGYTNGQHRACALRFSGAARAAVAVDDEALGEVSADWVYEGDG